MSVRPVSNHELFHPWILHVWRLPWSVRVMLGAMLFLFLFALHFVMVNIDGERYEWRHVYEVIGSPVIWFSLILFFPLLFPRHLSLSRVRHGRQETIWIAVTTIAFVGIMFGDILVSFVWRGVRIFPEHSFPIVMGIYLLTYLAGYVYIRTRSVRRLLEHHLLVCTQCRYPLDVQPAEGRCPECGTPYTHRHLQRYWLSMTARRRLRDDPRT